MKATSFITRIPMTRSRARYQFALFMSEYYDSVVITAEADFPFKDGVSECHAVKGSRLRRAVIFPFYAIILGLIKGRDSDVIYSDQILFSIIPAIIVSKLTRTPWVLTAADIPEGKYFVYKSHGGNRIIGLYHALNFYTQRLGLWMCDYIVLSDKSSIVDETDENVLSAVGGCDCEAIPDVGGEENISDKLQVVYVGNMFYHRGIDLILEAAELCQADISLRLMGPLPDDTSGIWVMSDDVDFHNRINQIQRCDYLGIVEHETALREMEHADVGIALLPYRRDLEHLQYSYPIKVFEYLATGTAPVATNTIALKELLEADELIDPESPEQLADGLDYWATHNEELHRRKQENRAKGETYCWNNVLDQLDTKLQRRILT